MPDDLSILAGLRGKWAGPLCVLCGLLMLAKQVYAYLAFGLISARWLGGGIGLLLIGAMGVFYYFDDRRSRVPFPITTQPDWLTDDEPDSP